MNAKFEKWCYGRTELRKYQDGEYVATETQESWSAWQAAIQSLEVTPELVDAAKEGLFGSSYYDLGYQGYIGDAAIHEALTSVFNAIKERKS